MDSDNCESNWSKNDLRLINHVEVFQHKPAILKKVESRLIDLQKALQEEITAQSADLPTGLNLTKNQIARGENHNGFPYISLDYPQNFSKTEMFTMRTLFWWGHYLGLSLILKGENLGAYTDRLLAVRTTEPCHDIYVSLAPNPFEWELKEENFSRVGEGNPEELKQTILTLDYLKIIRVCPIAGETFANLDWTQAGLQFWRDLFPVTLGEMPFSLQEKL